MPPPTDLSPFIAQLEDKGYCVIPNVVPKDLTTQARQLVDAIIGAPPPPSPSLGLEKVPTGPPGDPNARGQPGPWPVKGDNRPTIQSGGYTHSLHHPMPDGDYGFSGLMAKILQPYVQINAALLRCPESEVPNLKLMQQFFRRTDRGPDPVHGSTRQGVPPRGWHMDQAFLPRHYESSPRQMFYHTILACCPVVQDAAPFFTSTGSFKRAKQLSYSMTEEEQAAAVPYADMTRTKLGGVLSELAQRDGGRAINPMNEDGICAEYEEVHWAEGDLLVLDPMCTHSGSSFGGGGEHDARYVLFSSLFHVSAIGSTLSGLYNRTAVSPAWKFPSDLHDHLPREMRGLLEWELPDELDQYTTQQLMKLEPAVGSRGTAGRAAKL